MNPTTVLRGISQKLKMTITRSLEANFLTELAADFFFLWLKVCLRTTKSHQVTFENINDYHRSKIKSRNKNKNFHCLHMQNVPFLGGGTPPKYITDTSALPEKNLVVIRQLLRSMLCFLLPTPNIKKIIQQQAEN